MHGPTIGSADRSTRFRTRKSAGGCNELPKQDVVVAGLGHVDIGIGFADGSGTLRLLKAQSSLGGRWRNRAERRLALVAHILWCPGSVSVPPRWRNTFELSPCRNISS